LAAPAQQGLSSEAACSGHAVLSVVLSQQLAGTEPWQQPGPISQLEQAFVQEFGKIPTPPTV